MAATAEEKDSNQLVHSRFGSPKYSYGD